MVWHWMDYCIIAVIGLSMITGCFRGFVKELVALCVWVAAIWLAFQYTSEFGDYLQPYIHDKTVRSAIAFAGILLVTIIAGAVLNACLSFILHRSGLSGTDRVLGMGFGFVRGVFIVALIMLVIRLTDLPYQQYSKESRLYAQFDPLVNWLDGFMPQFMKQASGADDKSKALEMKVTL